MSPFPLLVLALVFLLIVVRRLGRFSVPIWLAMASGALAVLLSGDIGPAAAWLSIDADVMLFLFAMFVIGDGLERSGLLLALAYRLFSRAETVAAVIGRLLLGAGVTSALLMNDTLAVVGTPLVLLLAREHRVDPKLLLLTLAFAVTIGSVMSPIGNPQNLLIALHGGMDTPFRTFLKELWMPTVLNLFIAWTVLRIMFRREFHSRPLRHTPVTITDPSLARLAAFSLAILVALIFARTLATGFPLPWMPSLGHIGLLAASPLLLLSDKRTAMLRNVDWRTLLFFAALFVLMQAVGDTDVFQSFTEGRADLSSPTIVLGGSVLLSQLVSNVPLVALYLPLLQFSTGNETALLALAAGSTIAGNLLLLGAASNIIIVQNAEKRARVTLGFWEFARVGIPLTLLNSMVYWLWLTA